MINPMDRHNVFVVSMEAKASAFSMKMLQTLKKIIIFTTSEFVLLSLSLFFISLYDFMILMIVYIILAFSLLCIYRNIVGDSIVSEVNMLIYGDEYEHKHINNELAIKYTESIIRCIGKLDILSEIVSFHCIIKVVLLVILYLIK